MNENNPNLPEYVKTLPKVLQDLIFNWPWEERIGEIAKKYSLNYNQTESLINNVLFVLIGLDKPEILQQTLVVELKISKLLTDQIVGDLENRVFEYAIKEIEGKGKIISKSKFPMSNQGQNLNDQTSKPESLARTVLDTALKPKVPEVKPANLPMVEKGEVVHVNKPQAQKETFENRINYKPAPTTTSIKPEPVQRPVSVPRYDINNEEMPKSQFPMSNQNQNQNDKKVDSIIENKLKGVTTGTPEKTPPVPDAPRKYAVDPYREPTE
ncbi:MAG: hypothetical protein A3H52_00010 [Candidatus Zambryskibacteria bacterium RIFCSPLOWO2_02_FULL_39_26]|nr:MAG: hypothetical protein A2W51_01855 [Candidatus Zambryskibacteria bacterium RIFCSPHIGHO2_02_39_10]OHA99732.1 MAG: hypothetical protein A3E59_00800 [Candidatus Zambryskibacteria bacterium RIFCSPHIGHO2_12_FULL_39_47]OHB10154.1 MAG: hypothetical protein A3H52_00010 [Candidatus Zambryskibacteria bacterium RIFCSPLOWO2_02_FULL_39_26]